MTFYKGISKTQPELEGFPEVVADDYDPLAPQVEKRAEREAERAEEIREHRRAVARKRYRETHPKKIPKVILRQWVDREVLDWFRASGKGWQTRINQLLVEYIERVKAKEQGHEL